MNGLDAIGYSPAWAEALERHDAGAGLVPARVAEEHRGQLVCWTASGALRAEVSGRLRYEAQGAEELPGVGDWVALSPPADGSGAVVHHVLPRRTALVRKAPGRPTEGQLLAANVDVVFLVTSANLEFRPRRIERALALVREGGAQAVVVVSKRDLAEDLPGFLARAEAAAPGVPVAAVSALMGDGLPSLSRFLEPGRTIALLGSSGVGKSTLVNRLAGEEILATRGIRDDDDRGRHTTTHRQLVVLPSGGVLVDTPGLREIGLFEDGSGVAEAFPDIAALAEECRFRDCAHRGEPGCAITTALDDGRLELGRLESYHKLAREAAHAASRHSKRARHERRKRMKKFAKTIRNRPDKRGPRERR